MQERFVLIFPVSSGIRKIPRVRAYNPKKEQGVILGRPKGPGKSKLDAFRPEIESLLANGSTQKFIAHRYHTTEANLHNWLKKHGLKTAKSHAFA